MASGRLRLLLLAVAASLVVGGFAVSGAGALTGKVRYRSYTVEVYGTARLDWKLTTGRPDTACSDWQVERGTQKVKLKRAVKHRNAVFTVQNDPKTEFYASVPTRATFTRTYLAEGGVSNAAGCTGICPSGQAAARSPGPQAHAADGVGCSPAGTFNPPDDDCATSTRRIRLNVQLLDANRSRPHTLSVSGDSAPPSFSACPYHGGTIGDSFSVDLPLVVHANGLRALRELDRGEDVRIYDKDSENCREQGAPSGTSCRYTWEGWVYITRER